MQTDGGKINVCVIPAAKGNTAQVFPAGHKQMVWRRGVQQATRTPQRTISICSFFYPFYCLDNIFFLFDSLPNGMINREIDKSAL